MKKYLGYFLVSLPILSIMVFSSYLLGWVAIMIWAFVGGCSASVAIGLKLIQPKTSDTP